MMTNGIASMPLPRNEPVLPYAPGSLERRVLRGQLKETFVPPTHFRYPFMEPGD